MQDDRTPRLNLPLPYPTNKLSEDVLRLRDAFTALDASATVDEDGKVLDEQLQGKSSDLFVFKFPSAGAVDGSLQDASAVINPKLFGAVADGVADDSDPLMAAEEFAYSSGKVLLLQGSYRITKSIRFRRQFLTNGSVNITGPAAADPLPNTCGVYFERRLRVEGIIFTNLNVFSSALDGAAQLYMASVFTRNSFVDSTLSIGQGNVITANYDIEDNEFVWKKSRAFPGVSVLNCNLVNIERNKFQSFMQGVYVAPTMSFAANGITIRDNEFAACISNVLLKGSSMNRISMPVVENNVMAGSLRDVNSLSIGGIIALWCVGAKITGNQVTHSSDAIKLQASLDTTVFNNTLMGNTCVRTSGCAGVDISGNRMRNELGYTILILDAATNSITSGNIYLSKDVSIHDNEMNGVDKSIKIVATANADVRRNNITAKSAISTSGLLWFDAGVTNSRHYDNRFYAPSGTAIVVTASAAAEVTSAVAASTVIATTVPAKNITAPVITTSDPDLNNAASYVIEFSLGHYTQLKQMGDDTAPKTLDVWMQGVTGATLAWNSSPWYNATGKIGDIIINGIPYDNYDTEYWWWAKSMVVIDRQNRLTCRNFASTTEVSQNLPIGVTARQVAEQAWQTCTFRPPLIVDGAAYNPVPSGLIASDNEFNTNLSARCVLGQKANGSYVLLVVDGVSGSSGATWPQVQAKLLALGVVNAFNLDGGGSATLWYNGAIINHPSDAAGTRSVPVCMYI